MYELNRVNDIEEIPPEKRYSMKAVFDQECDNIRKHLNSKVEEFIRIDGNPEPALKQADLVVKEIARRFSDMDTHLTWAEDEIRSFKTYVESAPRENEITMYKWLRNITMVLEILVFLGIMITEELSLFTMIPAVILAFSAYLGGKGISILVGAFYNYSSQVKIKGWILAAGGLSLVVAMTVMRTMMSDGISYIVATMTLVIAIFIILFEFMYEFDVIKRSYFIRKIFDTQKLYASREHFKLIQENEWLNDYRSLVCAKSDFIVHPTFQNNVEG